jgi:hypothetical protein
MRKLTTSAVVACLVAFGAVVALVATVDCGKCQGRCTFSAPTWDPNTCSCTGGLDAELPSMDGGDAGALVIDAGADSSHADSAGVAEVPRNHRANDSACATPASPGQCGPIVTNPPDASTSNPCTSDVQCTAGRDGRCNTQAPAYGLMDCKCDYDTCAVDTDCPTGELCVCHGTAYAYGAGNTCMPGNCRVDSDCGEHGYCSPTAAVGGCGAVVGYYCHTAADTCINDSDCASDVACPDGPAARRASGREGAAAGSAGRSWIAGSADGAWLEKGHLVRTRT